LTDMDSGFNEKLVLVKSRQPEAYRTV